MMYVMWGQRGTVTIILTQIGEKRRITAYPYPYLRTVVIARGKQRDAAKGTWAVSFLLRTCLLKERAYIHARFNVETG